MKMSSVNEYDALRVVTSSFQTLGRDGQTEEKKDLPAYGVAYLVVSHDSMNGYVGRSVGRSIGNRFARPDQSAGRDEDSERSISFVRTCFS